MCVLLELVPSELAVLFPLCQNNVITMEAANEDEKPAEI